MDGRLHPQDWLLIIESLTQFGTSPGEIDTPRQEYAWQLADHLAAQQNLTTAQAIQQIDLNWPQDGTATPDDQRDQHTQQPDRSPRQDDPTKQADVERDHDHDPDRSRGGR